VLGSGVPTAVMQTVAAFWQTSAAICRLPVCHCDVDTVVVSAAESLVALDLDLVSGASGNYSVTHHTVYNDCDTVTFVPYSLTSTRHWPVIITQNFMDII